VINIYSENVKNLLLNFNNTASAFFQVTVIMNAYEFPMEKRSIILLFALVLDGGAWSKPRPGSLSPNKDTQYHFSSRLGGPQRQSGRTQKIFRTHGLDP
jgi:hypothetical protein